MSVKDLKEIVELCNNEMIDKNEDLTAILDINDIISLDNLIKENEELKSILDNKFSYITGARTLYQQLMGLDKKVIVKNNLELRNEINQYIKYNKKLKSELMEKMEKAQKEKKDIYIKFLESNKMDETLHVKGLMLEGKINILEELLKDKQYI